MIQATVKKSASIVGLKLGGANFESHFAASVLAIKRGGRHEVVSLKASKILPGDVLVFEAGE